MDLKTYLEENKVTEILIPFSGGGDSGGIDTITVTAENPDFEISQSVDDVLTEFCEERFNGEIDVDFNNEGGAGTLNITLDPKTGEWSSGAGWEDYYTDTDEETENDLDSDTITEIKSLVSNDTISSVRANYSGSGDSGGIDDVTFFDKDGEIVECDINLEEQMEDITRNFHSGYENNEGGHGFITISFADNEGTITMTNEVECSREESAEIDELALEELFLTEIDAKNEMRA